MEIFLFTALFGLIPALVAQLKGKSFVLWWFYGAMLLIVALPHSLIMSADKKSVEKKQLSNGMKKCPYCAEFIKKEALVCRYCRCKLTENNTEQENSRAQNAAPVDLNIIDNLR